MPIGEILDRYSIAILKKERASAENQQEIEDLTKEIETPSAPWGEKKY